jgi:cytoskeletal protein CcmA (bactofilin family)
VTPLDLDLVPEPPASPSVLSARHRRALVVGLGGGRPGESPAAKSTFAERRLRSSDTAATRFVDALPGIPPALPPAVAGLRPAAAAAPGLRLDDALVVPAGALVRGYVRCRALLLVGHVVGNVHCTAGPVVIRSGASLKGRLVATGDVYVCGTVGDSGGGAVIATRGKLVLAPGARVDGNVRSGRLDVHPGALLQGVAKACED